MRPELRITLPVTLLALVATGCGDKDGDDTGGDADTDSDTDVGTDSDTDADTDIDPDADGDGYAASEDCDDADPAIFPGADEVCDEVDNDCDDEVDEGVTQTFYTDGDGDGFGADDTAVEVCSQPDGATDKGGDCADDDDTTHPGADEVCGDGVVNNCLGSEEAARAACPWDWPDSAADADLTFTGEYPVGRAGASIAAGDINGDGLDDLLLGVPSMTASETASFEGGAYLFPGGTTASGTLSDADAGGSGGYTRAALGTDVDIVPDLDGDGIDDLIVGAPGDVETTPGAVYIVMGATSVAFGEPDGSLQGPAGLGAAVAGVGDVNGDGFGDLLVGSPNAVGVESPRAGAAHLLLGPATGAIEVPDASFTTTTSYACLGQVVEGAGDVDGDGLADLLVGAPQERYSESDTGRVFLMLGDASVAGGAVADVADAVFTGASGYRQFGAAAAGMGDIDGDGLDDVVISEPLYGPTEATYAAGRVFVYTAAPSGAVPHTDAAVTFTGDDGYVYAGRSLALGDVDADGLADVLIGGPGDYTEEATDGGRVYALLGGATGEVGPSDAHHVITGASFDDGLGASVQAGDFDGDGLDDILAGAPGVDDESAGSWVGAAFVFRNGDGF